VSYDIVQYLYNHVCCCQLRALHDFFSHVSTFLCQIRDLVTDAAHRARVLCSSACVAHPACCLGIGIMPIEAQSSHLFTELSDYHSCCKTPDSKCWMPTLVKEITVLQKMVHLLSLAKFYNRVCSAIMFTSLNLTMNRSKVVISLNALCTLVFERQFVVSWLLQLFQVGIPWITIQWVLSSRVANTCTWRRQLVMIMTEEQFLCARAHINVCKFPVNVIFFVERSLALLLCLASD